MVFAVSNIRVFDVIDIIAIALIFYKAIGFLRETRAGQLVKGIVILLFLYLLADWFELAVVKWLLSTFFESAIIVAVIIFQPEIRRVLERVGQTKLGRTGQLLGEDVKFSECIENICKAAGDMQKNKIGALIVFERKTQLGEIINTGTVIDAKPTESMVNNIFFPKSPLHDGAMIVRGDRLYAAGCILPLTQSRVFSSQLGTRHRAAIGMTENSDSVVLVVSEETGNISIVCDGQITRDYNAVSACAELKRMLLDSDSTDNQGIVASTVKKVFSLGKNNRKSEGEDNEK